MSRARLTEMSLSIHQTSRPGGQSGGTGSGLGTVAWAGAVEGAACGSNTSRLA